MTESAEEVTVTPEWEAFKEKLGELEQRVDTLLRDAGAIMVPDACYNDAVDCANRMKDQCLNRGGVKTVVFESTVEKCSATCKNGDVINCTKVKYPQT